MTAEKINGVAEDVVHVVAGVIVDEAQRVLLARRGAHRHQGGLWEFPGGKREPGETSLAALVRELDEEVGVQVERARPLIRVRHDYPDKAVLLEIWRVGAFRGTPHGREGQPVEWVTADELPQRAFPAANVPIVAAARLPPVYFITPAPEDTPAFWERFEGMLDGGVRLVQWRAPALAERDYVHLARRAAALCRAAGARMLLNAPPALAAALDADGVHLTSAHLRALRARPFGSERWVAASCHDLDEIRHAQRIGVDFVVAGPVRATASHPGAAPLGWSRFAALAEAAAMPVYALGGMTPAQLGAAFEHGAQGIAAISALWSAASPESLAAALRQAERAAERVPGESPPDAT